MSLHFAADPFWEPDPILRRNPARVSLRDSPAGSSDVDPERTGPVQESRFIHRLPADAENRFQSRILCIFQLWRSRVFLAIMSATKGPGSFAVLNQFPVQRRMPCLSAPVPADTV